MKTFFWLIAILVGVGAYLHVVQGWDWERARRPPGVVSVRKESASATTTHLDRGGTGKH